MTSSLIIAIALFATSAGAVEPAMRAMWVYKTESIIASANEQAQLFAFCKQRHITDLFWQVHFDHSNGTKLKDADVTHTFLRAAHAQALRIHTLGGDPSHTLTKNHERVLAMADALLAFNKAGEPFDGMHLDIEPHALPQWKKASDPEKGELLTQLVNVHTKVAERLRGTKLAYGADIVFWLDKTKPDGSPAYPVTYHGVAKDAAKHLLDVLDNVGIMSYRSTTEGSNGIIALVAKTIAYADTAKGRAFVGVKMANIGPANEGFFGSTESAMMNQLQSVDETYGPHRGYAGLAFFTYDAFRVMPK
jgi:hypothetical protein